jgi:perosamine synthetase
MGMPWAKEVRMSSTIADRPSFLPVAEPDLGDLEEAYLLDAYRSGWISSLGAYIGRFERGFAAFCEVDHAVAVCNGTAALHLALAVLGIGPGDEVIVPALTFVATAAAVRYVGATPVFIDCDPDLGTMLPRAAERALTSRTRAIIPVHLYGHPTDMDPLLDMAAAKGLAIIEDAAEAHGARYKGRPVGSLGHLATFSFYGNKLMTTGEGGMIVTRDALLAERLRLLRDHAMDPYRRYWHPEVGFNYRTTNLAAAIGCAQLERFPKICDRRAEVLRRYRAAFSALPQVQLNPARSWATPVPWLVCAVLPEATGCEVRDRILAALRAAGLDTRPYFIPINQMPPYQAFPTVGESDSTLPGAESLSARGFNLPSVSQVTDQHARAAASIISAALGPGSDPQVGGCR